MDHHGTIQSPAGTAPAAQQTGVSVGLEAVLNEQGSQGGMPAVHEANHTKRGAI